MRPSLHPTSLGRTRHAACRIQPLWPSLRPASGSYPHLWHRMRGAGRGSYLLQGGYQKTLPQILLYCLRNQGPLAAWAGQVRCL